MNKYIYEPREDSFLILRHIREYSKGDVLDMGTGTGILAEEALKYAKSVLAADINEPAVDSFIQKIKKKGLKNIKVLKSDLFENINEKKRFDLIIFNPPYLPDDEKAKDIALDGGKKGYEIVKRFLIKAKNYLKPEGKILLLFSSLTRKEVLDKILYNEGYKQKQIDEQKLDFERLYVYLIWM